MSQAEFEMISGILEVCKNLIQSVMFLVLWAALFNVKNRKRGVIAGVLFIVVNIAPGLLHSAAWVRHTASVFVVMGYCMACYKKHAGRAVFAISSFYNLHCLSWLIANSIYDEMVNRLINGIDIVRADYGQQMYYGASVGMILLVSIYTILLAVMTIFFGRLVKEMHVMAWQDVLLLSVLNFVGIMITNIVVELYIVEIDEAAFVLFGEKPDLLWKVPIIAVSIFAGETALIYFWQRYRILLSEKQKHFVEEQQVKAMKKRLEEAENFYGGIRKVRHEMKNHMANIKGLAGAGQYREIEEYVQRMDETMQKLEYKYATGNAVTDVIINDKYHRAQKAGICFEAKFMYGGGIPVFDFGIILNNLLDNAIEACEKLKPGEGYIRLTLKRKKHFLLLDVENSFDGAAIGADNGMLPPTTKQSVLPEIIMEHGIGLKNVREIAKRYFGGVSIKVKGNIFHVTVMLQEVDEKN